MPGFVNDSVIGIFSYIAKGHVKWYNITGSQFGNNYQEPEKTFMTHEPIILHPKMYLKEIIRDVHKNV